MRSIDVLLLLGFIQVFLGQSLVLGECCPVQFIGGTGVALTCGGGFLFRYVSDLTRWEFGDTVLWIRQ